MPEEQQIAGLVEVLEENDQLDEKMAPMLAAWSTGDVERLAAIMNEEWRRRPRLPPDACSPTATQLGRTGSRSGWRGPAPCSSRSAPATSPAADSVQAALQARGIRSQRVPHVEAN